MTVKGAKAKKGNGPSVAELKRQLGNERARADKAEQIATRALDAVENLQSRLDQLTNTAEFKAKVIQAAHDPSAEVARKVLGEPEPLGDDIPPPPDANLPPELAKQLAVLQEVGADVDADEELGEEIAPIMARNNPRQIRNGVHAEDTDIGQFEDRPMQSTGAARKSLAPMRIKDDGIIHENRHYSKDKILHEAFMHEYVYVMVQDTTDDVQTPLPPAGNGGIMQHFVRGQAQWVRRKFLAPLARAKVTTYTQRTVTGEDGHRLIVNIPHTTLLYPFTVIQDTEKGKRWLRSILAEPG
jgi:hypothetical protein